jgi:hypothetical protein
VWRFVGPSWRDARLHTAAVLLTIQVLGQTVLDFQLSIAQILISLGTAALLELAIVAARTRTIAWPASALLTGNGVALILRVPGTKHGDWWSLRGAWIFAMTAAFGIAIKWLVRVGDRPLFNPNNVALVTCFLVLGSRRVEPLDFWWGPAKPDVLAAIAVIVCGGMVILRRLRLGSIALVFYGTFVMLLGAMTAFGHCMTARWHVGELCGFEFWWVLVTSPEVLIFACFMITDPRTVPIGRRPQLAYAAIIAVFAVLLIAPQSTEFGAKVGLLASLTIVCAGRPVIERVFGTTEPVAWSRRRVSDVAIVIGLVVAMVVVAGRPARPEAFAGVAIDAEFPVVGSGDLPTWSVADDRLSGQVPDDDAAQIAHDLVQDLALQERAVCERDIELARASADRRWLEHLEQQMNAGATARERVAVRYDVDAIVVSVALRVGQEAPAVLATARGTMRTIRFGDRCGEPVAIEPPAPLSTTWEVLWNGERFLVVSDELPEDFVTPEVA